MAERTQEERFERNEQPLDYSANSGSMGNSHYSDGPSEGDSRPLTDTTFRVSESGNDSRNWKHMKDIQEGKYANDINTRTAHTEQKRDLKTFFNTINLSNWEEKYALCLLNHIHSLIQEDDYDDNTDEDSETFYSDAESLLLAVITFTANKNDRRIRGNDGYEELREALNVTRKSVRTARKNIRDFRNS
jgi:hypothetical protein